MNEGGSDDAARGSVGDLIELCMIAPRGILIRAVPEVRASSQMTEVLISTMSSTRVCELTIGTWAMMMATSVTPKF